MPGLKIVLKEKRLQIQVTFVRILAEIASVIDLRRFQLK